ncbi:hypothetical protein [Trichlorobacter lovleyi]|uniref:hypothetical protein n=1 Tax=Trichlorobacter lovleyi TaxID=313985 RepID=UPI003D0E9A40
MEWGAAVTAFLTLLLWVLKQWQSNQPKRDKEAADETTQQGRADIADGNADAVNDRIDRLLTGSGDTAGQPGGEVTTERISAVLGLADSGRSSGENFGKSGSLPGNQE